MSDSFAHTNEIQSLVLTYRDSILRLAYTYLKNRQDAEDVAQEVFVAYIQNAPVCGSDQKRRAWLMQVTANKCKNLLSSGWKKNTVALSDELAALPPGDIDLLEAVLSLDEKYRVPIHLFYYEGYSVKEIAALMKAKPATIGTRLARGRTLLKDKLGDDEYETEPLS